MAEQLNEHTFAGAHPSARDFLEQMLTWGFTRQPDKGVHAVLRGPHGGRVQILRSFIGRADAAQVEKAARLARITAEEFWADPGAAAPQAIAPVDAGESVAPGELPISRSARRKPATQDRVTSLVLAAHTKADRPLGFDEVVDLCGGRATRQQVVAASAALCRDSNLDRIRSGVYQWSGGVRTARHRSTSETDLRLLRRPAPPAPTPPPAADRRPTSTSQLLRQLFPSGVRLTPDMYEDLEHWTALTEKLTTHADAS